MKTKFENLLKLYSLIFLSVFFITLLITLLIKYPIVIIFYLFMIGLGIAVMVLAFWIDNYIQNKWWDKQFKKDKTKKNER